MLISLNFDGEKLNRGFVDIEKAGTIATQNTLNSIAFLTRKNALTNIKRDFTLRNNFTERNIRVDKAVNENINFMYAEIGATEKADYMKLQEEGGIRKSKGNGNLAIPQLPARSGSNKNLVARSLYLKALRKTSIAGTVKNQTSYKGKLIARVYQANKLNKVVVINKGIWKITSFVKSKSGIRFNKKLIYDLKHKSTKVHALKWLEPALNKPLGDFQSIFNSSINKLLRQKEII